MRIIITGEGPQSGKTEARLYLDEILNEPSTATSRLLYENVAAKTGVTVEHIIDRRIENADAFREDLIEEGNKRCDAGKFPSVDAFWCGYRIIDGVRRLDDLLAGKRYVTEDLGETLCHIHLVGRSSGTTDNTQPNELREHADFVLENNLSLADLFSSMVDCIDGFEK